MYTSDDYRMTFGYGRTDPPYGTKEWPYHRGDDWYMPIGTPILVNGVQIGISGDSGFVTGPHCHIGRFVNGQDTNPLSQGWTLNKPRVTDVGYDNIDGYYVGISDLSGTRWVYLHMQVESTCVKVGDYLDRLPKYNKEDVVSTTNDPADYRVNRGDVENVKGWLGLLINDGDYGFVGYSWKEFVTAILTGNEWKQRQAINNTDAAQKLAQIQQILN